MSTAIMKDRAPWIDYWLAMACFVSSRATCKSRRVGAVFVKDDQLLSTGFNGVPSGYPHPKTCKRRELNIPSGEQMHLCPCVHAERNGITNAAKIGVSLVGSACFLTNHPCPSCLADMVNARVSTVVYSDSYSASDSEQTRDIAKYGNIELVPWGRRSADILHEIALELSGK